MSQKPILLFILALLLASGAFAIFSASNQLEEKLPVDVEGPKTGEATDDETTGENVIFTITESERKKWEIKVKEAVYSKDHSGATLKGVDGIFYDDLGKPLLTFKSPDGVFKNHNNTVTLTHGVTVNSLKGGGESLRAATMTWSSRSDIIVAKQNVIVDHGDFGKTTADACQFSMDFEKIALSGNVRSNISP